MARPSNPRKRHNLNFAPSPQQWTPETQAHPVSLINPPKGMNALARIARMPGEYAWLIRNLMLDDGVLLSRYGTKQFGNSLDDQEILNVIHFLKSDGKLYTVMLQTNRIAVFNYSTDNWEGTDFPDWMGGKNSLFTFTSFGDKLIFSNGVDGMYALSFSPYSYEKIPGAPSARHLTTFAGRVIASAVVAAGEYKGYRVQWTAKNDYTKWEKPNDPADDTDLTLFGAGYEDLFSAPGGDVDEVSGTFPITDEIAYVVRARSIWQMTQTGQADAPFRFSKILSEIGTPYRHTIQHTPRGLMFMGQTNVYLMSAGGVQQPGDLVRTEVFEDLPNPERSYALYDHSREEYRLAVGIGSSEGSNRVYRYNFRSEGWTSDEYPFLIRSISRTAQGRTSTPIDLLTGSIDSLTGKIDDLGVTVRRTPAIIFAVPGYNFLAAEDINRVQDIGNDLVDVDSFIDLWTGGISSGTPLNSVEIHEVHIEYECDDAPHDIDILYSRDGGNNWLPYSHKTIDEFSAGPSILFCKKTVVENEPQLRIRSMKLGRLTIESIIAFVTEVARTMRKRTRPHPQPQPGATLAQIVVTPALASVVVGGTQQFSAQAYDSNGSLMSGVTFQWFSNNNTVATIDSTGKLTSKTLGNIQVSAVVGGIVGIATLNVTALPVVGIAALTQNLAIVEGQSAQVTFWPFNSLGQGVAGKLVTVQVTQPTKASITPASATSTVSGATFNISGLLAGDAVVNATCDGIVVGMSVHVVVAQPGEQPPGDPPPALVATTIDISPANALLDTDGESVALVVTVEDQSSAPLAGVLVSLSMNVSGIVTLNSVSGVTDVAGQVTFQATEVSNGNVTVTATCQSPSGPLTDTTAVSVAIPIPPPPPDNPPPSDPPPPPVGTSPYIYALPQGVTAGANGVPVDGMWNTGYVTPASTVSFVDQGSIAANTTKLQQLIDQAAAAAPGAITAPHRIQIPAGSQFNRIRLKKNFSGREIYLENSNMAALPVGSPANQCGTSAANRAKLAHTANMPQMVAPTSFEPAIDCELGAGNYRLVGLFGKFAAGLAGTAYNGIIFTSQYDAAGYQYEPTDPAKYCHHLVFDRCVLDADGSNMQLNAVRGIFGNGHHIALIDSTITGVKAAGQDAQGFGMTAGPGPYKFVNSFLEGAGEAMMFGGGTINVPGEMPQDILFWGCHFYLRPTWQNVGLTVKNVFEFKIAGRALVYGCVWDGWFHEDQDFSVSIKTVLQNPGASNRSVYSHDLTFSRCKNKDCGAGVNIAFDPENGVNVGLGTTRVQFYDSLIQGSRARVGDDGRAVQTAEGIIDLVFDHCTIAADRNKGIYLTSVIAGNNDYLMKGFKLRNCVVTGGDATAGTFPEAIASADGLGVGTQALNGHTQGDYQILNTILQPANPALYPAGNGIQCIGGLANVKYVNYPTDLRLAADSPGHLAGSDGKDMGADFNALNAATAGVI